MSRRLAPLRRPSTGGVPPRTSTPRRSERIRDQRQSASDEMPRPGGLRTGPGTFSHGPDEDSGVDQEEQGDEEDQDGGQDEAEEGSSDDEASGDSDGEEDLSSPTSRRPALVEEGVRLDPPETWHDDWPAWDAYLLRYTQKTMQVLPVFETMSAGERNRRLQRTKAGMQGTADLVPDDLGKYQRTFICTHGWKPRKTRAKGKRPRQHIRYTGCQFRFVVQWQNVSGVWKLGVKNGFYVHNHAVTPDTFGTYPSSRGVRDPQVQAHVEGMLAVGAKRSRIYDYLLDHDQNVVQNDVDNMVRRSKAASGLCDDDATAAEVAAFNAAHPENIATVSENESGEAGVISLSSAHMRKMFSRFPELVMIDSSHKTNCHNYQLLTFMVMNELGEGAVVQHSLVEANGDWHMERAIAHFRRANPDGLKLLRVLMVDKDLNEIRVLKAEFPEARVLICHFHAIKWLKEKRARPEYGKISSNDASLVDAAIHKMVYAVSPVEYDKNHTSLKDICSRIGLDDFFAYFEKNWDASQDMWVLFHRQKLPHFRNHTNNRLENFFGKLKDVVSGNTTMSDCIKALSKYDRRMAKEYKHETLKVGRYVHAGFDEEMANVLRVTNHFAANELKPQYQFGVSKSSSYTYTSDPDDSVVILVRGAGRSHRLNTDDWRCDCEFAMSMRLPCRHAIAYRKHVNTAGPVIPWARVDERWMNKKSSIRHVPQFEYNLFNRDEAKRAKKKLRTHVERYREAVRVTQLVSSELADIADEDEFERSLQFVMSQWRALRQGDIRALSGDKSREPTSSSNPLQAPPDVSSAASQPAPSTLSDLPVDSSSPQRDPPISAGTSSPLRLRLAAKVNPPGRPKKDMKQSAVNERVARVWYESNEKAKDRAGQRDLREVAASLDKDQPGLQGVADRIGGIVVKDMSWDTKKPTFKKLKNPVLILDAFYLLPPRLLDKCIAAFPVSNKADDAVDVSTPTPSLQSAPVEVVQIPSVGQFSRLQIETFRRMENLKKAVEMGFRLRKWIMEEVFPAVPTEWQQEIKRVAEQVLNTYPYAKIRGFEHTSGVDFSLLYRATPPCWLNDACIELVCQRLSVDYPSARFAGIQTANQQTSRARSRNPQQVDGKVLESVRSFITDGAVDTIMIPVNFPDTHWCSLIVRVADEKIFYYDSMHQIGFVTVLADLAKSLKASALTDFVVIMLSNPIQTDLFSCGVFTCWSFIRWVVNGAAKDYSDYAMTLRRFGLFYYILTGHHDLLLINPPPPGAPGAGRVEMQSDGVAPASETNANTVPSSEAGDKSTAVDSEMKEEDDSVPATQPSKA